MEKTSRLYIIMRIRNINVNSVANYIPLILLVIHIIRYEKLNMDEEG